MAALNNTDQDFSATLSFAGIEGEFRVSFASLKNGGKLWVESKSTHRQYELVVDDFSDFSPEGFTYPGVHISKLVKVRENCVLTHSSSNHLIFSFFV